MQGLNAALGRPTDDPGSRAKVILDLAFGPRQSKARSLTEASLRIFEDLGDRRHGGWALHNLGRIALRERKFDDARAPLEASLAAFRAAGDAAGVGTSLGDPGIAWLLDGDLDRASACFEESLALLRGQGDHWSLGYTLYSVADLHARRGENDRVRALLEEALAHFRRVRNHWGTALVDIDLALLDHREGDDRRARSRLMEAVVAGRYHGVDPRVWEVLLALGVVAIGEGAFAAGLRLLGAAVARVTLADPRPTDRAELEESLATARSALGEEAFATAWAEGQAMTLEQAVVYALEDGGRSAAPSASLESHS